MKYPVVFIVVLIFFTKASAQNSVVAASASGSATGVSVDWTVGDVVNESATFVVTGDIKEEKEAPSVYPVPFENEFFIEQRGSTGPIGFSLFDPSGKAIKTSHTSEGSMYRVSANGLISGLYVLVVKQQNSNLSHVFKIIKK